MVTRRASARPRRPFASLGPLSVAALVFLAVETGAYANVVPTGEVFASGTAAVGSAGVEENGDYYAAGFRIGVDADKNGDFKGSALVTVTEDASPAIDRAYAKVRFPWIVEDTAFRLTLGKAPLAWGKGFLFNAGDPIFAAIPDVERLSTGAYRVDADWMAVAYAPLGDFSFAEAVALPPIPDGGDTERLRSGARIAVTPAARFFHSAEAGYLYERDAAHKPFVAIDGSLFFDWYAAASADVPARGKSGEAEFGVSGGIFRLFRLIDRTPIAARCEFLLYPRHDEWLWYPSVEASITDTLTVGAQAFLACENKTTALGASWQARQGLELTALASTLLPENSREGAHPVDVTIGFVARF